MLCAADADLSNSDVQENTAALQRLEDRDDVDEMVKTFIGRGVAVNARAVGGKTPLHLAFARLQCDGIRAPAKNGADCNARDGHGATPLHYAVVYLPLPERTFGEPARDGSKIRNNRRPTKKQRWNRCLSAATADEPATKTS